MNRVILLGMLFIPLFLFSDENQIDLKVTCTPKEITIGDPFRLEFKILSKDPIQIKLSSIDNGLSQYVRKNFNSYETNDKNGYEYLFVYELTTFEIGKQKLGPFQIKYQKLDQNYSFFSKDYSIDVRPVLDLSSTQISLKDVPLPKVMKEPLWHKWIIGLLILFSLVFIYIIWKWFRMKNSNKQINEYERLSPMEIALKELSALKHSGLVEEGQVKLFYIRLSAILKNYISRNYGFLAIECTTYETNLQLKSYVSDVHVRERIKNQLEIFDLVKFAKFRPKDRTHAKNIDDVIQLVQFISDHKRNKGDIVHQ